MKYKMNKWVSGLREKPDWDTYFISLALLVSQRSIDESTACGAILVSNKNRILSTGYNGPISNSNDKLIPTQRPDKYYYMIHAEENCILSCDNNNFEDSRMYITGRPCHRCLRMMLQRGIKNIIYWKIPIKCVDLDDLNAQKLMLNKRNIKLIEFRDIDKCKKLLSRTSHYIEYKSLTPSRQ
jgi:dCMP deaminase